MRKFFLFPWPVLYTTFVHHFFFFLYFYCTPRKNCWQQSFIHIHCSSKPRNATLDCYKIGKNSVSTKLLDWLYTFLISHFAGILWMFSQNTPQNMEYSLYTFRISCEFRVLLIPRKNKTRNPLSCRVNADPGTKCKKQKKGRKTQKK